MSAVDYAIRQIKREIPDAILKMSFGTNRHGNIYGGTYQAGTQSMDMDIREKVIVGRVIEDINLFGGTRVAIPFIGLSYDQVDKWRRVYHIDPNKLGGLNVICAYEICRWDPAESRSYYTMDGLARDVSILAKSIGNVRVTGSADCKLVGPNKILVYDAQHIWYSDYAAIVQLSHDPELNALPPESWKTFAQLCVLAAKAYIWNDRIISLNLGANQAGVEIGTLREIISDYQDSNELFDELFEMQWRKLAFMSDHKQMQGFIDSMIGKR